MDAKPTTGEPAGPDIATSDARGDSTRDRSPAPAGEPPLLDTYLPDYDVTELHACVVNADAETTWAAISHGDLAGIPVVRALLLLRALPGRVRALAGGRPAPPAPPFTFDDMPRVGFELLAEHPGEIAFGFVGRPWRVGDERPVAIGRGLFSDFSDPGYTKIAFAIRAQPYGAQRTLVVTETRIAATDVRSRRLFAVYWKLIGPFSALIRRAILRRVRSDAERAGSSRSGARAVRIDGEIVINRPVDEVFDFVADERNEPRFNPRMLRAEQISAGPVGLGTRFRAEIDTMGRKVPMTIEFTAYERPRRLASSTHLSMMDTEGALTFDPVPGGTRMRWSWNVRPRGLFRLMTPIVGPLGRRQEQTTWDSLKRFLESREAASSPLSVKGHS